MGLKVTEFAGVTMISYPTFYFKNSTKLIKIFDVVVAFFSIIPHHYYVLLEYGLK